MKRMSADDEFSGAKSLSLGSKRRRRLSFSEDEGRDSKLKSPDSPPLSKIYNSSFRNNKPAELFRKDLISAMKLPDSEQLDPNDFWYVSDSWKQEWERGVQVPVNSKNVPVPKVCEIERRVERSPFKMPKKYLLMYPDDRFSNDTHVLLDVPLEVEKVCRYDMDDLDSKWLEVLNEMREEFGLPSLSEETLEVLLEDFELQCFNKFQEALQTEEGLGIEYDENVICDVCRMPECEEGNEMVFCDVCNVCVHQACYGITAIPEGSWVCRTCAANVQPNCILCPNKGGAMKSTKSQDKWAHVSCALWIPEVVIVDAEKMEPITKISQIPQSRWALICTICRERTGACIQCCVKQCKVAYHVTCAFKEGLEMNAVYNESREEDGVKLRSYCLKHSEQGKEAQAEGEGIVWRMKNSSKKEGKSSKISDYDKHSARLQKIREMEAEFYTHVDLSQTKVLPGVDADVVDQIFNYWKLKRTANFNKPLLPTKLDETALLGKQPEEDSLYARMKMFVHLRQDLERVRNLCYMVSRREKMRRSFFKAKEEVFMQQVRLLDIQPMKPESSDFDSFIDSCKCSSVVNEVYSHHYTPKKEKEEEEEEMREQQLEKQKEEKTEKKKLASASRLPNPYAKLYFNGIHTRSRGQSNKSDNPETHRSYSMRRSSMKKSKSLENVNADNKLVDCGKKRASISTPVVIRIEAKHEDPAPNVQEIAAGDGGHSTPVEQQKDEEPITTERFPAVEEEEEEKPVAEDLANMLVEMSESLEEKDAVVVSSVLEEVKQEENIQVDIAVEKNNDVTEEIVKRLSMLETDSAQQLPLVQNIECDIKDANKENVSVSCDSDLKKKEIVSEEPLSDIKNSPSQSDKENVIAHPKSRGRKSKFQHETKSTDLAKAIEELTIDNKIEKQEKNFEKVDFRTASGGDGLKTMITRSSRYEMRSRKQTLATPQAESMLQASEKLSLSEENPVSSLRQSCEASSSMENLTEISGFPDNEDSCENDKEVIEVITGDRSLKRKIRLSLKRRPDSLFRKAKLHRTDFSDGAKDALSCESPVCEKEVKRSKLNKHNSLFSEHTEYKMSVRQNGKVLLSPVKKPADDIVKKHQRDSVTLHLKDRCSSSEKEAYKHGEFLPVQPDQQLSPASSSSSSSSNGNRQQSVLTNRDVTSSPRLVIRLVKDPDCKQWQRDTISPNAPTSFKVVRNDWEGISDDRTCPLTDSDLEARQRENRTLRTHPKNQTRVHRYEMRSRSKQTSSTNS